MKAFRFSRPRTAAEAASLLAADPAARLKASGIDLLDRMKEGVDEPEHVVGLVDAIGLDGIRIEESGSITLGAGVTLAALARSEAVRRFLPSLAEAAGSAASPQIRNRATLAGNLAQHTRCGYYRHASFPCLKRSGDTCPVRAEGGVQDTAAVFGNALCASAHPSSVAPVLGSLDTGIVVRGSQGERTLAFDDVWAPPAAGRASDTVLEPDEVIVALQVPPRAARQHVGHVEIRQKAAFDWALVSCAVRYELEGADVSEARIWLGSVAPAPWRARAAEKALVGGPPTTERLERAAQAAVEGATPLPGSRYKLQLARVAVQRALVAAGRRD